MKHKYNKIDPSNGDYRRASFMNSFVSEETNPRLKAWCDAFRQEPDFIGFAYNYGGGGTPSRYAITKSGVYQY